MCNLTKRLHQASLHSLKNIYVNSSKGYQGWLSEQVYYTRYPERHQGQLGVIKTKTRNIINAPNAEKDQLCQNDEIPQINLTISNDVLDQSVVDRGEDTEEVNRTQLNRPNIEEYDKNLYIPFGINEEFTNIVFNQVEWG